MTKPRHILTVIVTVQSICSVPEPLSGALPREVRKELTSLIKEARSVSGLVRRKNIDEARTVLEKIKKRIGKLNIDEDERDRTWRTLQTQLQKARNAIPVSFENEVAPILTSGCVDCHSREQASASLRLDTFSGLRQGGRNGPLLQPRRPINSLIIARLTANDPRQRMPRDAKPLQNDQLNIIARWIAGGAIFDGEDQEAPIGESAKEPVPEVKVEVVMADGSETVSFTDDVAPIMVNFCLRCHQDDDPSGGFSVVTIKDVLRGGDSGNTIIPGDSANSYLWHLVGLQDPLKMPPGQALLKRSQARTIKRWIDEDAHFDGDDSKATLRSMVPTEVEKESGRLASMSDEEFGNRRLEQAATLWKRAAPREEATSFISDNFCVYGNPGKERLKQLAEWGESQVARLQERYAEDHVDTVWRGRLILFACNDRFEYEEFNTVLRDRRTPREIHGHVVITLGLATAYAIFHDRSAPASAGALNSEQLLNSLVAQAWLVRDGSNLPDWLQQGFGVLESGVNSQFMNLSKQKASTAMAGISSLAAIFNNGVFGPGDVSAVGSLMTRFLQTQGNAKFGRLVEALRSADSPTQALEAVYGQPADAIAAAFLRTLPRQR